MILEKFKTWANGWAIIQEGLGYEVELKEQAEDAFGKSIVFNLDSEDVLSQIVLWDSGLCFIQIIKVDSEKVLLMQDYDISETLDFDNTFQDFLQLTGCCKK